MQHSAIVGLCSLSVPIGLTLGAAWQDLKSREISDWFSYALLGWAMLATSFGWNQLHWSDFGIGLGIGVAVAVLMCAVFKFGAGDGVLLAALGATLGWKGFLVTLIVMSLAGGVMSVIALIRGKRDLAYGPAIAAGVIGYACLCGIKLMILAKAKS